MSVGLSRELFHIHIDAESMDPRLSNALLDDRGFSEKNFVRDGRRGSEHSPHFHITRKYSDHAAFNDDFDFILAQISAGVGLEGYIEGEFIALNRRFEHRQRDTRVEAPFKLALAPLPEGSFRQTELHLTASSEESDPDVLDSLFDMGFFCAYAPKEYGMAQVFTAQGSYRSIAEITPLLVTFIEEGGLARVRLKEERIVRWWASSPSIRLPPIIHRIDKVATPALGAQFANH